MQVFPLLQHVGAGEHERKTGHPKLAHEPLVHAAVHATHRDLLLQRVSELRGQGRERRGSDVGEVDGEQEVEGVGSLRQLVERVEGGRLSLLFEEQTDEVACQGLRRARLRLRAKVERGESANGQ